MRKEIFACIKKDFLNLLSYILPFSLRFLRLVSVLIVFYFVSRNFNLRSFMVQVDGSNVTYPLFVLTGIAINICLLSVLDFFSSLMEDERMMGTLEALLMSTTRITVIIIAKYIWSLVFIFGAISPILVFGVYVLHINFTGSMFAAITTVFVLSFIVFGAISIILASFVIGFEKCGPVTLILNDIFKIFGGFYFPIAFLPKSLQLFSYCLPISYSLGALRKIIFQGSALIDILPDIFILLAFSLILWPLSIFTLKHCLRIAKEKGSLSRY